MGFLISCQRIFRTLAQTRAKVTRTPKKLPLEQKLQHSQNCHLDVSSVISFRTNLFHSFIVMYCCSNKVDKNKVFFWFTTCNGNAGFVLQQNSTSTFFELWNMQI